MNSQASSIPIPTAAGVLAVEILVCCSGFNGPLRQSSGEGDVNEQSVIKYTNTNCCWGFSSGEGGGG